MYGPPGTTTASASTGRRRHRSSPAPCHRRSSSGVQSSRGCCGTTAVPNWSGWTPVAKAASPAASARRTSHASAAFQSCWLTSEGAAPRRVARQFHPA
eukprot:scaffold99615_cov63-Phaeocystis_antarctica.AAC.3